MSTALGSREPTPDAPWLGLQPFTEAASQYFFGRTSELAALYERVTARPLTLLFGPSGFGKSSLLQAALVPRLRDTGFMPVLLRLRHDDDAPSLEQQVFRALSVATVGLGMQAKEAPSLWYLLHDPEYGFCLPGARRLVLILDQFEEIFTIGQVPSRARQSEAFLSILAALVENRVPETARSELENNGVLADRIDYAARPCRFLLSMREDYLHQLERYRAAMPSMMNNRMELRLLSGQQALKATVEPGRIRCHLNPELRPIISEETGKAIVRFVADASEDASLDDIDAVPPYFLSLLCEQLNLERQRLSPPEINSHLVSARGKDILDHYYEESFERQPEAVRRQVEDDLVSEGGHRNAVVRGEFLTDLQAAGVNQPELHLDALVARRLLTIDVRGGHRRVELAHDMLTSLVVRSRNARRAREALLEADRQREALFEAKRQREALLEAKRQQARRVLWVGAGLAVLAVGLGALAVGLARKAERAATIERRTAEETMTLKRQFEAEREKAKKILESAQCTTSNEVPESVCGPRGGNIGYERDSCAVPFVSFDPMDKKAYDAVACEFWKKRGIRVKRISCSEEGFTNRRKDLLTQYRGGVFAWMPGQPIAPVVDLVYQLNAKSWEHKTRETWFPLIQTLRDGEFGGVHSIPFKFYPWAIYYHKGFIKKHGPFTYLAPPQGGRNEWRVPKTWEELIATAKEIQSRNLPAFAFSFAQGHKWTAMGTFDILNMRLHGHDAHEKLMRGVLPPSDKEAHLKELFKHWAKLVPYYKNSWGTDTVENSAIELQQGKAGMYLTGSFFLKYVEENDREEFGMFDFPRIETPTNANIRDTDAIDAPIDTFVISTSKDENSLRCAEELLTFLGTDEAAFQVYNAKNGFYLPVNKKALGELAKPTQEDNLQRQAARQVMRVGTIAGFTDRRVWRLEGQAVAPALQRFLDDAYKDTNTKDAISAVVGAINVIGAAD